LLLCITRSDVVVYHSMHCILLKKKWKLLLILGMPMGTNCSSSKLFIQSNVQYTSLTMKSAL